VLTADVPFWPTFWPTLVAGVVASLLAGAFLLGIGYWLIDRRLHLRDRADRVADDRARARQLHDASLHLAHQELQATASKIDPYRDAIAQDNIPYPPFDDNGWVLVSQGHTLATLKPETAEALMNAYNRIRSANGQMVEFAEVTAGPTAALVHSALASASDSGGLPPQVADVAGAYEQRRADLRRAIGDRLDDLRGHIDQAIDAIEVELRNVGEVPSAQRKYLRAEPLHDLTQPDA
jgi:hypothetical protein